MNFIRDLQIIILLSVLTLGTITCYAEETIGIQDTDSLLNITTNNTVALNLTETDSQPPIPVHSEEPSEKNESLFEGITGTVSSFENVSLNETNQSEQTDPPERSQATSDDSALQKAYTGWYEKGVNASKIGNYQSASDAFAAALRINKKSQEAQLGYASALSELGDDEEVLSIYSNLHNLSPNNTEFLLPLGRAQNAAGKYDLAVATLFNVTNIFPENSEGWSQLAAAYAGQYRYEDALTAARKSLQISLDNEGGWGQLGCILYGQGRYYEAIAAFEKALTLNPKDGNIWMGLGDTWSALRKYESATEAYTSATKLRPYDNDLWIKIGSVYEKKGDKVNASEAYMKAEGDGALIIHTEENSGNIDQNQSVDTALNSSMNESASSQPSGNSTNTTEP